MEIKASSFKLRANAPKGQKRFPISAHITTMDISPTNGAETNKRQIRADIETVENGLLKTAVVNMGKFTKIEFEEVN